MNVRRSKKACITCKRRKKRCSGGLPCEYCIKIGRPQDCEYQTKVPSKRVKVTERYLSNLKQKIKDLERQLNSTVEMEGSDDSPNTNPLIIEDESDCITEDAEPDKLEISMSRHNYRLGDSACGKFLQKIKLSLAKSCDSINDFKISELKTISFSIMPNIDLIRTLASENCPPLDEAKKCILVASKIIGADYMYMDPNYDSDIMRPIIYNTELNNENLFEHASELTRFFAYLALGCLFNEDNSPENTRSKFPGLKYFEITLKLQSELLKVYDRVADGAMIQSFLYVSYYALSLDKPELAFILIGNAIRMMFTLGYHKKTLNNSQNRIFWLCFVYDRFVAVRFGFPLMINELDIEVPLLNEGDSSIHSVSLDLYHFISQVKLARITTQIIRKIYTRNSFSFIQNCNTVLNQLKNWLDDLPIELKLDYSKFGTAKSRSTINLHINYNYSIIITTRPVLFYVFNKVISSGKSTDELFNERLLSVIKVLLESNVQAAQIQSMVMASLYFDGKMVNASFLDCHYIFSASIILIFSAFCQSLPNYTISLGFDISTLFDRVKINLEVLQHISQYNISASNFNRQLTELIELISSKNVQDAFKGTFETSHSMYSTLDEESTLNFKSAINSELLRNLDLTRILDDISDNSNSSDSVLFDNEDFMKYTNSFL